MLKSLFQTYSKFCHPHFRSKHLAILTYTSKRIPHRSFKSHYPPRGRRCHDTRWDHEVVRHVINSSSRDYRMTRCADPSRILTVFSPIASFNEKSSARCTSQRRSALSFSSFQANITLQAASQLLQLP